MISWRYGGSSFRTRMRARSSALMLETGLVPYAARSGWIQARRVILGL